jgi:hypothetical protein
MTEQTYALAEDGVYGQANGVYQDALSTIPDNELESFEWYPDESITDRYGGNTGSASIVQSNTTDGDNALSLSASSGGQYISDTTNFDLQIGRTYQFDITLTSDSAGYGDGGVFYFTQDETATESGYHARIHYGNEELQLYEVSSGSFTLLGKTSTTISGDTTYSIKFEVNSEDEHTASLIDSGSTIASLGPVTDGTHTGSSTKGLGWRVYAGGMTVDYFHPPNLL